MRGCLLRRSGLFTALSLLASTHACVIKVWFCIKRNHRAGRFPCLSKKYCKYCIRLCLCIPQFISPSGGCSGSWRRRSRARGGCARRLTQALPPCKDAPLTFPKWSCLASGGFLQGPASPVCHSRWNYLHHPSSSFPPVQIHSPHSCFLKSLSFSSLVCIIPTSVFVLAGLPFETIQIRKRTVALLPQTCQGPVL